MVPRSGGLRKRNRVGALGQGKSCRGEGESRPLLGEGCQVCSRVLWALLQEEGKATEMRCYKPPPRLLPWSPQANFSCDFLAPRAWC